RPGKPAPGAGPVPGADAYAIIGCASADAPNPATVPIKKPRRSISAFTGSPFSEVIDLILTVCVVGRTMLISPLCVPSDRNATRPGFDVDARNPHVSGSMRGGPWEATSPLARL